MGYESGSGGGSSNLMIFFNSISEEKLVSVSSCVSQFGDFPLPNMNHCSRRASVLVVLPSHFKFRKSHNFLTHTRTLTLMVVSALAVPA